MPLKRKPLVTFEGVAVIAVVLVIVVLAVLALENFAPLMIEVPLTVFGWHAPALPLGVVVLLSCLLGALLLWLSADNHGELTCQKGNAVYRYHEAAHSYVRV
jgi:uncharacterized integral membrane protein